MIREVTKVPKVALCRECHGTGYRRTDAEGTPGHTRCPQCEGSGRVLVSCKMTLDIRPYKSKQSL